MTRPNERFLRLVLSADAALSGIAGIGMIAGADAAAPLLGLPAQLLSLAGAALLGYAAFLGLALSRATLSRPVILAAIAINGLWALECLLLPALGWVDPTGLGMGFLIGQAVFVILMADLVWLGLRRTVPATA